MNSQEKIPRSFGTHDGTFHADEVTACALLLLFDLVDRDKIFRTRDPQRLAQCDFVCDVGGTYDPKRRIFDHHQADYAGALSSAGMVLEYLRDEGIISEVHHDLLRRSLIAGIDAHDNGKDPQTPGLCTFSHVVSNFTPIIYDAPEEDLNRAFHQALDFVLAHLTRLWERRKYHESMRQLVEERMEQDKICLMFDRPVPWLENFFELGGDKHPALYLIMPAGDHWKLRGIPPTYEKRMQVREPLPEEWAGLLEEELQRVAGIPGAIFCHKGRFVSVWETRDDALKALDYVLKKTGRG